jgi:hypothetical protein
MKRVAPDFRAERWLVSGATCIRFFFTNFAAFISLVMPMPEPGHRSGAVRAPAAMAKAV